MRLFQARDALRGPRPVHVRELLRMWSSRAYWMEGSKMWRCSSSSCSSLEDEHYKRMHVLFWSSGNESPKACHCVEITTGALLPRPFCL